MGKGPGPGWECVGNELCECRNRNTLDDTQMIESAQVKTVGLGVFGTATSWGSTALSLELAEAWLRLMVLAAGLLVPGVTVWCMLRLNRVQYSRELRKLCEECQKGNMPRVCALTGKRGEDCPLRS